MKITVLKETRKHRVSLCLDGEYIASLDMLTVGDYGLCVGDEIDEETLEKILRISQSRRAKSKAIELLSYRPHSRTELKRKLLKTATEEDAEKAVARMEELEMVNDKSFAESLVRELSEIKYYGEIRVRQELYRRGIDRDTAEEALSSIPDQRELLSRYLESRQTKMTDDRKEREKLIRRLLSRGFNYDDIQSVLREYGEE